MFDTITKFLFRRRTAFLPFVTLAMLIFAKPTLKGLAIGLVLVAAGEAMRVWSAGHLVKSEDLTMSGPFEWVRNPLYVGSLIIALGYCAMTGGWIVWAVVVPLFFATHSSAVRWEERYLLGRYGDAFANYCKRVPRWLPKPPSKDMRSHKRFSAERAKLNSEPKTLAGTLLVVVVFAAKYWYFTYYAVRR